MDCSSATHTNDTDVLLRRGVAPHRVSLEDYVAYQWESAGNLLGARHGQKRDTVALDWMRNAVTTSADRDIAVLDVGCAYGNHLFMLNALLGKPQDVEMVGVDLFDTAIRHANVFAQRIPGYSNCRFQVADLSVGLPFEPETFSAVNFCDVLEHMAQPEAALHEIRRVAKPGATVVVSTPLKDSLFKRIASLANQVSQGGLYRAYYAGKDTQVDKSGRPVMKTAAGHDHVSEMALPELKALVDGTGFDLVQVEPMSVMSGSRWFDRHPGALGAILLIEAIHERLRRPSWAHSVMLRLEKPSISRRA